MLNGEPLARTYARGTMYIGRDLSRVRVSHLVISSSIHSDTFDVCRQSLSRPLTPGALLHGVRCQEPFCNRPMAETQPNAQTLPVCQVLNLLVKRKSTLK